MATLTKPRKETKKRSRPAPCCLRIDSLADISLASRLLGYEPRIDFAEDLRRTGEVYAALQADTAGCLIYSPGRGGLW